MGDESRGGDFIAGMVIGGFVGAALALLLAPRPGDETLAQLREKSIVLKERAADLSAEAMKRVGDLEEKGKAAIEEQKERIQSAVKEGTEAAQKKKDELLGSLEAKQQPEEA